MSDNKANDAKRRYGSRVVSYDQDIRRVLDTAAAYADAIQRLNARYLELDADERDPALGLRRDQARVPPPAVACRAVVLPVLLERAPFVSFVPRAPQPTPEMQARVAAAREREREREKEFARSAPDISTLPTNVAIGGSL